MDTVILRIKSNFGFPQVSRETRSRAQVLAKLVAKEILKELKIKKLSTASGFAISSGEYVALEIRSDELANLLLGQSLLDSEKDRLQTVNIASIKVLSDLRNPVADTKFGRLLEKSLSSTERDLDVEVEVGGEAKSVCFSKNEPQIESNATEVGIFLVDSVSQTKARCVLLHCLDESEIAATFDISGSVKSQIETARMKSLYASLSGASVFVGKVRSKKSFVIKECLEFFDEKSYAKIRSGEDFHSYFTVVKNESGSLNLLINDE